MEEDDEENDNVPDWAQYGGFADTTGDGGGAVEENNGADDLGQILCDVKKDCESEKEVQKLERYEQGAQKVGYHAGIAAMEGKIMALLTRHLASY
uniref:Transposon protein, putative, CACTA, En/Spm sub-class n=1 Tax=Oryza sativa subsp. japonica TaxID=39947 RepID=Q53PQ7_ORYSJ|nr:transposon protein, putative, CACTA, En/Spm sub-class [Oryza sativa Japonica Group]